MSASVVCLGLADGMLTRRSKPKHSKHGKMCLVLLLLLALLFLLRGGIVSGFLHNSSSQHRLSVYLYEITLFVAIPYAFACALTFEAPPIDPLGWFMLRLFTVKRHGAPATPILLFLFCLTVYNSARSQEGTK